MANGKKNGNGKTGSVEKERSEFRALLAENPNYFGTAPGSRQRAVARVEASTKYEELVGVGLYPELDLLVALVAVKLPVGYRGTLCNGGSWEYVRFFVDWDGDGDYADPDEDAGIAAVNVHDIPDFPSTGATEGKPLVYALRLKISPQRKPCKLPRLLKVRAILSWENPPVEGDPDFPAVWGNVLEKWVQIPPAPFRVRDIFGRYDQLNLKFDPALIDLDAPVSRVPCLSVPELAELYRDEDVPAHRYDFPALREIAHRIRKHPSCLSSLQKDPRYATVADSVAAVLKARPSTKYEELRCVGLNYDLEELTAILTVKLPCGYNGDLCTEGSREYVAFWFSLPDEAGQHRPWQYAGTATVRVHDSRPIPIGGLQYAVYLPVELSSLRQHCGSPLMVRVRAVLSWNARPDPGDPDQLPVWGNRIEALIQVKPGASVAAGAHRPSLWSVGNMAVESIAGNPRTLLGSSVGDGYANGASVTGGFIAVESPFGGAIAISGRITHPPDNPAPNDRLRYKVQYKKNGGTWRDILDDFQIMLRINGVPAGTVDQVADGNGYFCYRGDDAPTSAPPVVEVGDNLLALWRTPVGEGDGLYRVRVLLHAPGAPAQPGVPADHLASSEVRIMIDNTPPAAALALDTGACRQIIAGDVIPGKFTATDPHIWSYALTVQPEAAASPPAVAPGLGQYPVLPAPGVADAVFTLSSSGDTTACRYVLRLLAVDRAIVDNRFPGHRASADAGFCLLDKH